MRSKEDFSNLIPRCAYAETAIRLMLLDGVLPGTTAQVPSSGASRVATSAAVQKSFSLIMHECRGMLELPRSSKRDGERFDPYLPSTSHAFSFHATILQPPKLTPLKLRRFLSSIIREHVLPPTILPPLLLNLRIALFPGNARGPPAPEPPSAEERLQTRRRAAQAILSLVPPIVARSYFSASNDVDGKEDTVRQIEDILDVFGNAYLNKHLVYNILELVVVRLVPELQDSKPSELLSERGVSRGDQLS